MWIEHLIYLYLQIVGMQEDNKYPSLHEAIENSGDDEAVVDAGFGNGFKVIDEKDW